MSSPLRCWIILTGNISFSQLLSPTSVSSNVAAHSGIEYSRMLPSLKLDLTANCGLYWCVVLIPMVALQYNYVMTSSSSLYRQNLT